MKNGKMTINFENDRATFLGRSVGLSTTASGHNCMPLSL